MKVLIEISENDYWWIKQASKGTTCYPMTLRLHDAIKNGTPLSKGHGKLVENEYRLGFDEGYHDGYDEGYQDGRDGCGYCKNSSTDIVRQAVIEGTSLSEVTNGDVIKLLFPQIKTIPSVNDSLLRVFYLDSNNREDYELFDADWWNAPYKAESGDKE